MSSVIKEVESCKPEITRKLEKAHVSLMRNGMTAPYIGAMMLGESKVTMDPAMPTACTDGVNKYYNGNFIEPMSIEETRFLVAHEVVHVAAKHIPRHMDLCKQDKVLANACFDYNDNDILMQMQEKDPIFLKMPKGGLWDKKFRDWSVREIWHYFNTGKKPDGTSDGKPKRKKDKNSGNETIEIGNKEYQLGTMDQHDIESLMNATPEQIREIMEKINNALHQGSLLAGRMGVNVPREIKEAAEPEVDWRDVLRDFLVTHTRGADEYTFRKYNKRRLADDYFLPSTENEKISEIIVAIDTSGSIGQKELAEFAAELASICESARPERLRVLWWDTAVDGEQLFLEQDFSGIKNLLKPQGGGGTMVSCVSKYILDKKLDADCVVVFTDGYVESDIKWTIPQPTLWMVTQCASFTPPVGKLVKYRSMQE